MRVRTIGVLALAAALGGCGTLGYYSQSIGGQLRILADRRPVAQVLQDPAVPATDKQQLRVLEKILVFAHRRLYLPDNGSYRSYVQLDRPYVVWNVFAAPEFSMQPVHWCYLAVGCLDYRGYFNKKNALAYARYEHGRGYDVFVGGVTAYSTLGWFQDPVLSTMLERSPAQLAQLIFHELAHQKLYIDGDTDFNEAYADTVADIGTRLWLAKRDPAAYARYQRDQRFEDRFTGLALEYRTRLQTLYSESMPPAEMRRRKLRVMEELQARYQAMKQRRRAPGAFDGWFAGGLNNAKFVALSTYQRLVPQFMHLYHGCGDNLKLFYAVVDRIGHCNRKRRYELLRDGNPGKC